MKISHPTWATCLIFVIINFFNSGVFAFLQPSAVGRISSTSGRAIILSTRHSSLEPLQMMELSTIVTPESANAIAVSSGLLVAETEPWVQPVAFALGPFLNFISFAMLCRVVASWYPNTNLNELPWSIIAWPTEPLLRAVRGSIPPAFGVDITPVFWVAVFTFINEILLGQQGLLTMKIKYGI